VYISGQGGGLGPIPCKDSTKSLIFFTHSFCSMIHENYQNKDILIFYVSHSLHCLLGLRSRIQHNNRINVYYRHNTASQYQRIKTVWSIYYNKTAFIFVSIFHLVDIFEERTAYAYSQLNLTYCNNSFFHNSSNLPETWSQNIKVKPRACSLC
jgi:hypothetical protein